MVVFLRYFRVISRPMGQWSEPMTAGMMYAFLTFGRKAVSTKK